MLTVEPLRADLDLLPTGPTLAAALAELDLPRLTPADLVAVPRARYRQLGHDRGAADGHDGRGGAARPLR